MNEFLDINNRTHTSLEFEYCAHFSENSYFDSLRNQVLIK